MNISKAYEISFPLKQVYAAWVSSNTVIPPATAMDIAPKVGGHYRLIMDTPEFKSMNEGTFLIVEPDSHIRYTWEWNKDGEVTEIDVKFVSTTQGTRISLEHTGFVKQESANMHEGGWDSYIEGFILFLNER